jgi:molybdenum cofactor guanylyltransferase
VGCDASEVQDRCGRVVVNGQVVRNEARASSKRVTGCGEPGVDRRQSTEGRIQRLRLSRQGGFTQATVGEHGRVSTTAGSGGVTGVLLVGGESRRFGSPKALARLGEKTFADIAWERLAWCDERLACGKLADGLPLGISIRDDESDVRAPLAGVVAGLRGARFDVIVALPVDLPLVTDAALQVLASACTGDAAVPQTGPLPGAYRRSALPILERRLRAGELALAAALDELETCVVEVDPSALVNVNYPKDLPPPELVLFSGSREIVLADG